MLFRKKIFSTLSFRNFNSDIKNISPVRMSYKIFNSDLKTRPILIMHGLLGSKMNWHRIGRELGYDHKVVIMDARNHGDSPHSNEMSYEHLSEDVHLLIKDHNFTNTICVGHSMGGRAMMMLALNYPQFIDNLIVVDMSPFSSKGIASVPKYLEALGKVQFQTGIPLGQMRKLAFDQLEESIPDKDTRNFLLTNLIEKRNVFTWKSNIRLLLEKKNEILKFNLPENKTFEGPTLFIAGAESDFLLPNMHPNILKIFPKAEFLYVEGAGHNVHYDKPTEFIKHLKDFINK